MKKLFVGGNWKLNGNLKLLKDFSCSKEFNSAVENCSEAVEVVIFPAFPYLSMAKEAFAGSSVAIGAQNCHSSVSGAFTGEVSLAMLQDLSVDWVLLGHSERRSLFAETDDIVGQKFGLAVEAIRVILCVGEREEERESGSTERVIEHQLAACLDRLKSRDLSTFDPSRLIIAYEPVWAIGTGKVATPHQAQQIHHHIRRYLAALMGPDHAAAVRIIYGGSVSAASAPELAKQTDIDGFLVGGASLKIDEFTKIIKSI